MTLIQPGTTEIVKPDIDAALLRKFQQQAQEQHVVILHCRFIPFGFSTKIRIWKSTYLIAHDSDHRSALLHAERIEIFPEWTNVPGGKAHYFTLVFEGLPESCTAFDMLEEIPEPRGFYIPGIRRNHSDVYQVDIN